MSAAIPADRRENVDAEVMDIDQLASYLRRDARELHKLANRGQLPGMKVGGEWRFASAEISYWLETQIPAYTDAELTDLEAGASRGADDGRPLLATLLSEAAMTVSLSAGTKSSLLREMVALAEQTWQIYDPPVLLAALQQREELGSTAQECGVVLLHPHRPLGDAVQGEALIAYGRTTRGLPFGAPNGALSDLFFLVCCRDRGTHVLALARLARLLLRPGFVDQLRAADTVRESYEILLAAELQLTDA